MGHMHDEKKKGCIVTAKSFAVFTSYRYSFFFFYLIKYTLKADDVY